MIVENQILNQIVNLLGTDPRKMNLPVSEEDYQKIISEVVGYCDTLTEATFGAISPAVGHPLQKLFGVEQFIGLAILYKGELEATMLIVFQKGKAVPSQRFFQSLANLAAVAFWRKKADQARQESETRFQQMAELLPQGIFECNRDGFITYANQQAALMFGFPYFYRHIHFLEVFGEDQRERMLQKLQAVVNGSTTGQHEYHLARQDGSVFPALIRSSPVTKNGQVIGILGAIVDITEFKQVEQKLQRSNRFLRATSRCNLALVHAADSQSLFNEICSTLVEENGYRFAWIGLFEEDERGAPAIKPVANAGLSGISLTTVNPTCGLSLLDCSPMLEAIQSKEPVVIEDIITDIRCQVCREEAVIQNLKSLISLPLIYSGKIFGGITVYASHQDSFSPDEIKVLQEMSSDVAFGIHTLQVRTDRDQAITRLEEVNRELSEAYDATLQGWSKALELRERETAGHSQRVVKLTLALAEKMGIPEKQFNDIRWGAYLHDIGKIGIPDAILLKPGKLTEDEWSVMRLHPEYAYKLVSSIPFLKNAAEIPHLHHERWNGSGYPFQLKGEAIPLAARIFAVVDVWDALTYDRPYRLAWSANESKKYLCENAGTLFDPEIIPIFLELIEGETGEKT